MKRPKLQISKPTRDDYLIVLAALLGAGAFPPLGLWPLSLVSIALFLWQLRDREPTVARNLGVEYGLVYSLATMYWFFGIFGPLSICLMALMAGYFGLLANLIAMTRGRSALVRSLLIAMYAVGVEWLRGDAWYLRFPWYTVPHALAQAPSCVSWLPWVGAYGLSFIIWFIAAWGVLGRAWNWALIGILPLGWFVLPAVPPPDRTALLLQTEQPGGVETMIPSIGNMKVDLAVLPEYAYFDSYKYALRSERGPSALARKLHCPVVFGAVDGNYYEMKFQNVAVVIDDHAQLQGLFVKQRPVPLFADGRAGSERPVFPVEQGTLGVAVCYDLDAPAVAASLVHSGATVLVVPTYDAMSWSPTQHLHHELLLRLRAMENDRWIVRAASSGRSEAIDPHGTPTAEGVEIGQVGTVTVGYGHRNSVTVGSYLHWIGPGCAGAALLFVLREIYSMCRHRREETPSATTGS